MLIENEGLVYVISCIGGLMILLMICKYISERAFSGFMVHGEVDEF